MKLRGYKLLTDENVRREVMEFLRSAGFDVFDVKESGRHGESDVNLLRFSVTEGRVVVTHDSDFGRLAIAGGEPIVGILYLRPGHVDPSVTVSTIQELLVADPDVAPAFIIVAEQSRSGVRIRIRQWTQ